MFFNQDAANPQKEEWDEVKTQWLAGDIKEVVFFVVSTWKDHSFPWRKKVRRTGNIFINQM